MNIKLPNIRLKYGWRGLSIVYTIQSDHAGHHAMSSLMSLQKAHSNSKEHSSTSVSCGVRPLMLWDTS